MFWVAAEEGRVHLSAEEDVELPLCRAKSGKRLKGSLQSGRGVHNAVPACAASDPQRTVCDKHRHHISEEAKDIALRSLGLQDELEALYAQ